MARHARQRALLATGAVCALASLAPRADASGFQLREMSATGLGSAFSGATAGAEDLSAIYLNPAAMSRFDGTRVQAGATYVMPTIKFSGSAGAGGMTYGGGSGGNAGVGKLVPAAYALVEITPDIRAGISVNVPFGLATKYDSGWEGRYFAIESEIENIVVTPSVSWQATEKLSLGAGLQIGRSEATLSNALNLMPLGLPDGHSELHGDGFGVGFNLGLLYEFTPETRVGLSYRSQVKYTLEGDATISGVPDPVVAAVPALQSSKAKADVTMPDVLSAGIYHRVSPELALKGEVSWTNWATFDELRVRFADGRPDSVTAERWEDSWFVSVGLDYSPLDQHTFRFGLAFDQSPVPDSHRTARIPDADRYWLSVGYSYEFGETGLFSLGYTHLFFDNASINETTSAGTLSGRYEGHADIFSAGLAFRF